MMKYEKFEAICILAAVKATKEAADLLTSRRDLYTRRSGRGDIFYSRRHAGDLPAA